MEKAASRPLAAALKLTMRSVGGGGGPSTGLLLLLLLRGRHCTATWHASASGICSTSAPL